MNIDRYIEIRNCYKNFVYKILKSEKDDGVNILRAGERFGFLTGERNLTFEDEDETNVLMDFILYEKNGLSNRLVDRYLNSENNNNNEIEKIILEGMVANYFSLFEIIKIDIDNNTLELSDQLENNTYTLKDIGLSSTADVGSLLATRLVPIEDIYTTSGLSFAFENDKRLRLLTEIAKNKKRVGITLVEIMFRASKNWGINIVNIDTSDETIPDY